MENHERLSRLQELKIDRSKTPLFSSQRECIEWADRAAPILQYNKALYNMFMDGYHVVSTNGFTASFYMSYLNRMVGAVNQAIAELEHSLGENEPKNNKGKEGFGAINQNQYGGVNIQKAESVVIREVNSATPSEKPKPSKINLLYWLVGIISALVVIYKILFVDLDLINKIKQLGHFGGINVKISKATEDITLLYLFKHDFGERLLSSESEQVFKSLKDSSEVRILSKIFYDFEAQSEFIGIYIPPVTNTFEICASLVNEYKDILESDMGVMVETSHPGLQPVNKAQLKFSGRVFIYHEYPIFEDKKRELLDLYKKNGLSIQFRGSDYLWTVKSK